MRRPPLIPSLGLAALVSLVILVAGCHRRPAPQPVSKPAPPPAPQPSARPYVTHATCPLPVAVVAAQRNCDDEKANDALIDASLDAFDRTYDAGHYAVALACAEEAARDDPGEAAAHIDRAQALDALGHPAQARDAYDRALALDPDDPDALEANADFLWRRGTDDALEAAALEASRGAKDATDPTQVAELLVLEAKALNDLGQPDGALKASGSALAAEHDDADATIERAVALFELDRFDDARPALAQARRAAPKSAKAAYYAALFAEREGHESTAAGLFRLAAKIDPGDYPLALDVSRQAFGALVAEEIRRLPKAKQQALASTDFSWTEIPSTAVLLSGDPVLSPEIVGVYRPGAPGHPDAIMLYRKNLLRLCGSVAELHRQVHLTLLHELGHLAGLDDAELRDRGL